MSVASVMRLSLVSMMKSLMSIRRMGDLRVSKKRREKKETGGADTSIHFEFCMLTNDVR